MHDYRQLDVYEDARHLVRALYEHTSSFPQAELFGLTQQIRRSAISVASNIAEGAGRDTNPDFAGFLSISIGSACELECQLTLSCDLGYLGSEDLDLLAGRLRRILGKLRALRRYYARSDEL